MAILSAFDFTAEHLYEFCMDNKMYSEDCYYLLANAGIIGIPCVSLQVMCIPAPIAGFLLGGGVRLGLFCLACLAISCVVYCPFVKILDAQALKEEQANAAQNAAE